MRIMDVYRFLWQIFWGMKNHVKFEWQWLQLEVDVGRLLILTSPVWCRITYLASITFSSEATCLNARLFWYLMQNKTVFNIVPSWKSDNNNNILFIFRRSLFIWLTLTTCRIGRGLVEIVATNTVFCQLIGASSGPTPILFPRAGCYGNSMCEKHKKTFCQQRKMDKWIEKVIVV